MFDIVHSRKHIEKELSKCQKLNYNAFRWWRWYEAKNKPLHSRKPFRDKIFNGDFDYSCYGWQAMLCEYMMNDIEKECGIDIQKFNEKSRMLKPRRTRLWEDFHRDEAERLENLIKEFTTNFRITKKEVEKEMLECSGEIIDLYYIIEEKYGKYNIIQSKRRGRPRKI